MRKFIAAIGLCLVVVSSSAEAQVLVTSVTASFPDPNGKVPGFNAVPGSGIPTWSSGWAQGVLTQNQFYTYCVSWATETANGGARISYRLARGKTVIQSSVMITQKDLKISSNGEYYYCSKYLKLPVSPGAATLTGTVVYYPPKKGTPVTTSLDVPVVLQ